MRALREARPGGLDGFLPCVASGLRHDKKKGLNVFPSTAFDPASNGADDI